MTNTLAYFAPFATADENNYPNIDHGKNKFVEGSSEKVNRAFLKENYEFCLLLQPMRNIQKINFCSSKQKFLMYADFSGILNCNTF